PCGSVIHRLESVLPGQCAELRAGPGLGQVHDHLDAFSLRHLNVGDHQVEWLGPQHGARLETVGGFGDRIASLRDAFAKHLPQLAIVFNDKHLYYRGAWTLHTFLALYLLFAAAEGFRVASTPPQRPKAGIGRSRSAGP